MKRKIQNENNQRRWFELAPVSGYWVAAIVWNDNPGDPFWSFRDFLIGPLFIRTRCSTPTALSLSLSSCLGCSEKNLFHKRWAAGETNSCDPQRSFNESSGMKTFRKIQWKTWSEELIRTGHRLIYDRSADRRHCFTGGGEGILVWDAYLVMYVR